MHADRPGDRPRLLYWYRTAPGIVLGRSPLDEDAIRTIEEQHPGIDFDWPAILALSEVMTPEEEAPAPKPQPQKQRRRSESNRENPREPRRDSRAASDVVAESPDELRRDEAAAVSSLFESDVEATESVDSFQPAPATTHGLLEELVGREIATRLRARYSEIMTRIHEQSGDAAARGAWEKRAEPLNPEMWLTPDAILDGVRRADNLFEQLRIELVHSSRE